jgi:hypothetical protein
MSIRVNISAWREHGNISVALGQLTAADAEYDFSSMAKQWLKWGALSPKQAALVIWRLQVHGIVHDPAALGLRIETGAKDREQLSAMAHWQLERLLPYLSPEQRAEFGI